MSFPLVQPPVYRVLETVDTHVKEFTTCNTRTYLWVDPQSQQSYVRVERDYYKNVQVTNVYKRSVCLVPNQQQVDCQQQYFPDQQQTPNYPQYPFYSLSDNQQQQSHPTYP